MTNSPLGMNAIPVYSWSLRGLWGPETGGPHPQSSAPPRSMALSGVFLFSPPAGAPVQAPALLNALDSPPVNEFSPPRDPLFRIFPS